MFGVHGSIMSDYGTIGTTRPWSILGGSEFSSKMVCVATNNWSQCSKYDYKDLEIYVLDPSVFPLSIKWKRIELKEKWARFSESKRNKNMRSVYVLNGVTTNSKYERKRANNKNNDNDQKKKRDAKTHRSNPFCTTMRQRYHILVHIVYTIALNGNNVSMECVCVCALQSI